MGGRAREAVEDRGEPVETGRRGHVCGDPPAGAVAEQTAVHERSAGATLALYGAAANDPALDGYLAELIAGVGRQIRRLLEVCRDRGWLRDDIPFDELVETAAVIASIDTFIRMTHRDGWTVDAYRAWSRRMLDEVVFAGTPTPVSRPTPARRR